MYKKILVTLRTYNDVDHIVPIIWELLEKGHHVFVFGISNYDFSNDYRMKFIKNYKNIKIFLPYKENKFYKFLKYNIISILIFLIINKIDSFVSEWKRPTFKGLWGQFFYASKILGIVKIAVPHGYNVFLNHDVNDVVSKFRKRNPKILGDRNEFDYYVLATDIQRDQAVELGINQKIAISLGSTRYSYKWHKILNTIERKTLNENSSTKTNICLMTPHWSYNVNKEETFKMIESISCIDDTVLFVKPHTRDSGNISNSEINDFKDNVKYTTNETSHQLISKTDIVITFGSSIIFEAILQNKYILNPKFLHTNQTIFDNEVSIYHADNIYEVIENIKMIKKNKPTKNKSEYENILKKYVYNNSNTEPIDSYIKLITKN